MLAEPRLLAESNIVWLLDLRAVEVIIEPEIPEMVQRSIRPVANRGGFRSFSGNFPERRFGVGGLGEVFCAVLAHIMVVGTRINI